VTTTTVLKTLLGTYPHTKAIKDGTIKIPGVELEFVEIEPVHDGFGAMADRQEFDVAEMAITTYILARSFDKPITGLPVVVSRNFHHRRMLYNVKSGIREPKDLEGKRVGLRAYTQTMPLWNRGVLKHEYGVDLDKIKWVVFEGAHVKAYQNPANVEMAPSGKKIGQMLVAGELDAAIGAEGAESPDVKQLIPNAAEVEVAWFKMHGVYPINHMITLKNDLVAANPGILEQLFAAFKEAKQAYMKHLESPGPFSAADQNMLRIKGIVGDPLPYGVGPNRRAIELAAQFAYEQHIVPKVYTVEELFRPEVLELA
jgi:ABC-type nitrate/sulfonate/bicarbonate transport system substrate-binding protein